MAKTIDPSLLAVYQSDSHSIGYAIKITRADGGVVGLTTADVDCTIGGQLYLSDPGFTAPPLESTSGLAVSNAEIKIPNVTDSSLRLDIVAGYWKDAPFELFRFNQLDLAMATEPLMHGTLGEIKAGDEELTVELRDYAQKLQQPIAFIATKTCPYRLGSTTMPTGGLCKKDISSPPFTVTGTVTTAVSRSVFIDTSRAEADDYFVNGKIVFTSGNNAGLEKKVTIFASGQFTIGVPFVRDIQVGDTYTAVVGCDGLLQTCIDKFNNKDNFGGMPHAPGSDQLASKPD